MRLLAVLRRPFGPVIRDKLDFYSQFHPSSLSMQQFLDFARGGTCAKSYLFLKKELLVRLANIMQEIALLPQPLLLTPSCKIVRHWYETSFTQLLAYEDKADEDKICQKFTEDLKVILKRHKLVVETMAEGVMEMKQKTGQIGAVDRNLQYFLDRFYINRIGIRMLINQHVILFGGTMPESPEFIGCIHPTCDVEKIVNDAYDSSRFLCERYYMKAPSLDVECKNASKGSHGLSTKEKITMVYVPSHLYHMLFELIKNAMRAVVEYNDEQESLPPIKATIVCGKEDLSIKISDRGGGVPRSITDQLFNYMYTTAPPVSGHGDQAPLAGYGYGLPLSRLYARYFLGDLFLVSMEGLGTDACIYLKALPIDASELLPVFTTSSKRIYKSSQQASDWSQRPCPSSLISAAASQSRSSSFSSNDNNNRQSAGPF